MKSLICRLFGHAKPHINYPRKYVSGIMHYQCRRCECWTTNKGR